MRYPEGHVEPDGHNLRRSKMKQISPQTPIYKFFLRDYQEPIELSHAIRDLKITRMIYTFVHSYIDEDEFTLKTDVIKYGKGADYEWQRGTWGSRVYRQAGNIPGWTNPLTGPNGEEMLLDYLPNYQVRTQRIVHKDDIIVMVADFTNYKFLSESQFDTELRQVENHYIEQYNQCHGFNPAGNSISETASKNKGIVADVTWKSLFFESKQLLNYD
jgi:hypothetical protein